MTSRRIPIAALLAALGVALAVPAAQPDKARAEANLKALTDRIQRVQQQVQNDVAATNRATRNLRDAERKVSKAQGELTRLRSERDERAAARRKLEGERSEAEAEHARTTEDLGRQLRTAYFMGRNEPLKLLLNQRDPAEFSRNLTYYGYLGRLRADQIAEINANIARIGELTAAIEAEDVELARLELQQKDQVGALEATRKERGQALVSLERESKTRAATLSRMRNEKQQLERLVERLSKATEGLAYDPKAPFVQARGRLGWPAAGKIIVNYGATVAGLGRSDGIDIDTDRGAPVKAVHEGRVIFADWLSLRGQLLIIDHGNGFWSVYGHLGEIFKETGERVSGGETIASAGDSGGRKRPGLYFEIRRNKSPVDPRGWFRSPAPPAN